ncbi:hypothetical protein Q4F19_15545 [Sphingomonas sp. BIUV-7]|uniref:DUF11 domain-containing protein n=1 Tax=Sphingomonas natans TaxID=3063330 RepID=A0ABT8YBV1_9SPHN|nr:hypothetical protein [Sphingomonas sp. BIUV-7]MDO6415805.1 hypothetical protein [Sphingomonas sp. BIUV-7]
MRKAIPALLAGSAGLCFAGTAQAAPQTTAGTVINNTASVTYTVNGTAQSSTSTTATFVVDRKVNFTVVTDQSGMTQVNLGQQNAVTTFKVTNLTNDAQDFLLDPDQQSISLGILPGTDNFDMLNLKAYVDSNGNGVYDAGVDTATYIDELAPDASVAVFLVGNVPTTPTAQLAFDSLHVIVAAGGATATKGTALIATDLNLANADNTVDIVFADDDSDGTLYLGDIARNGQGRAYSGYEIGTHNVALTVTKSARIVSDGVNLLFPKALPGATVEYCLLVNNATLLTAATGVNLSDVVPVKTTYVPGSISIGLPGVPGIACVLSGSAEDDDADDAAESDGFTASFDGSTKTVAAHLDSVNGASSIAVAFKVTIN